MNALVIDPTSERPPFEQVRAQIRDQVATGALVAGDQLPTVRRLAADLGLAANTVARAYKELEHDGVVVTAGRRGTVVADPAVETTAAAHRQTVAFVASLRLLGLSPSETIRLVRQVLDE